MTKLEIIKRIDLDGYIAYSLQHNGKHVNGTVTSDENKIEGMFNKAIENIKAGTNMSVYETIKSIEI